MTILSPGRLRERKGNLSEQEMDEMMEGDDIDYTEARGYGTAREPRTERMVVGIDPDVDKSGVAIVDVEGGKPFVRSLESLPITEITSLMVWLKAKQMVIDDITVVVEAGWLNKPNWHLRKGVSLAVAARMGVAVGRNQQVGMVIRDIAESYGIKVATPRPLAKTWRGRDGKITHKELEMVTGKLPKGKSNQEERDACLLAWVTGGFPVRIDYGNFKQE